PSAQRPAHAISQAFVARRSADCHAAGQRFAPPVVTFAFANVAHLSCMRQQSFTQKGNPLMPQALDDKALDQIFREARTHSAWLPKPLGDDMLRKIYDLMKFGPTSANTTPMRIVFVKSPEAKQRLKPALSAGNVEKTMAAPVCAIVAD